MNDPRPAPDCPDARWIDDCDTLQAWLSDVDGLLAVDTEFMRTNTYFARLALVQLGHDGRHALVDPLTGPMGDALAQMDRDRAPTWIMHSPSEDLEVMAPFLPRGPSKLFDTQLAAAFAGMGLGISYRALVEHVCGVVLDKGETRSNWMQRPLTSAQKTYATLDVVYLETIHDHLETALEQRGRMAWFQADCERLMRRTGERADDDQPQRALRGASTWPRERQALLRRILLWREATARELDQPRPWLLQDAQILSLVENRPHSIRELTEHTRGQRALRGPQRQALLEQLQQPVTAAETDATAAIPDPLDNTGRRVLNTMKKDINALADELDLPAGLIAPRKVLEELIATGTWPRGLEGWRRTLLHDRLAAYLPG